MKTFVFKHTVELGMISLTKTDQHLLVILLRFAFWLKQQTKASGYFLFNQANHPKIEAQNATILFTV